MGYSNRFCESFILAYCQCQGRFQPEKWRDIWESKDWHNFMRRNPAVGEEKPVLQITAEGMGLEYWPGEPLTIDKVFAPKDPVTRGGFPVPIIAAIEEQNTIGGFDQEVFKLSSVRCRLKVGIIYPIKQGDFDESKRKLEMWAKYSSELFSEYVKEDKETEYLFLLGTEENPYELHWYAFSYTVGAGSAEETWHRL